MFLSVIVKNCVIQGDDCVIKLQIPCVIETMVDVLYIYICFVSFWLMFVFDIYYSMYDFG